MLERGYSGILSSEVRSERPVLDPLLALLSI